MDASTPTTANETEPRATSTRSQRLLLIKLGAMGDVVMAVPAAAAMHAEGYSVDWVASEAVAPVLRLYPWIHVLGINEAKVLRGSASERLAGMLALWRALGRRTAEHGAYDVCATLYYDRRYDLLRLPVRARRNLRLSRTDRARMLLPGRHHTDEYHRVLSGRTDAETPGQLAPVPVRGLPVSRWPIQAGRPRVVLVPAGARNVLRDDRLRRWPVQSYVQLAGALVARGCEVVLAGGPQDHWASEHFADLSAASPAEAFSDQIGRLSLLDSLALLESASVTVVHDTGPLHLAGVTSTAIVAIFGPTDPHGRLPQRPNAVALWGGEGFACRPCYDGRDYAPCPHNGCVEQVTPTMVLAQVEALLRAKADGSDVPPRVLAPAHAGWVHLTPGGRL